MKKLLFALPVALGLAASAGAANAVLTYTIWNDASAPGGLLGNRSAQPPIPTSNFFAAFTDPGNPISFNNTAPEGSSNTFADFFTAAVLAECNAAHPGCGGTTMSTFGDAVTTFIEITGLVAQGGQTITINHDDGGTVYEGCTGNGCTAANFVTGNPAEAADNAETGTVPGSGPQTLTIFYTEDNGAPAILDVTVHTPEPASLALLGVGLLGLGFVAARRRN